MAISGSAAKVAAASESAQAVSIAVRAGDSLVVPSGASSSFARCRVSLRLAVRPFANRRNWLAVAAVAAYPAAVAAVDEAAVAAAADLSSAVCALRAVRVRVVCTK